LALLYVFINQIILTRLLAAHINLRPWHLQNNDLDIYITMTLTFT